MRIALLVLTASAAVAHLLLAGAGVIRLAVQLPARHRLGPVALASYLRRADLGRGGLILYPLLGAGGPLAAWAALAAAYLVTASVPVRAALSIAAGLCVLHVFTTTRAAPAMMRIGRAEDRPEVLSPLISTFTRWSWPRTILQVLSAAALTCALMFLQGRGALPVAVLAAALAATALVAVLAGGALDQVVVQLPVRRKVGTAAYAAYLRAADLRNGRVLYPLVGLSSNAALVATLVLAVLQPVPVRYSLPLGVAAGCGVAALLVTRRTIPAVRRLAAPPGDADELAADRFIHGARARAPLFLLIFSCLLWTLIDR